MPKLLRSSPVTERAQAIVEFALVFPILMLLLIGLFEVGRMIYVYAAVNNASREAVRYGSAVGYDDSGELKYKHCAGIRQVARRSAFSLVLQDSDITIRYDHGPGTAVYHTCTGTVDPAYFITYGDRILVTVTGQYRPYTRLVPWGSRQFVSSSARTVLGYVDLAQLPTSTVAPTDTPVVVATETPTVASPTDAPTMTATMEPPTETPAWVYTLTSVETPTITLIPYATETSTANPSPEN